MTESSPDDAFQAVQSAIKAVPDLFWMPCQGGSSDYRYVACYLDDSGNQTESFRRVVQQLEDAGFMSTSQGNEDTALSTVLMRTVPSAELNVTYSGSTLRVLMQHPETGKFGAPPRKEGAPPAFTTTYARQDNQGFARQMLYNLLIRGGMSLSAIANAIQTCPEEQPSQLCARTGWTQADFEQAMVDDYFAGNREVFSQLNAQPTFTYNEEPLVERKAIETPAIWVQKNGNGTWTSRDRQRYPGVEVILRFKPEQSGELQMQVLSVSRQP
ncbi:hypothetical protein K7W42_11605 [Deinococcus sp. HMF7604]|uniref:hypothetical protein n=1 Tax=Deinococcus betulae TaxID=2873312 RepID=UPI001CCDC9E5|nr:hypothetical protein [Deinococcus betulae]MBZ9751509.1 hypothetical protein [Deinococcus betulae]